MDWDKENKKYFGSIFEQIKTDFNRCFWPKEKCQETAIRAHSIQNADILDLLCENDHVIMPQIGINIDTGPYLYFNKIGRKKATTFTGLCEKHDAQLFEPIDKYEFSATNPEQLFLLAYRSVMRELHAKMKSGVDIQRQYNRGVEIGRFNPELPDQPMKIATMGLAEAYMFYLYKFHYDQIYLKQDYRKIEHQVELIEDIEPTIAVSSVYSYVDNMRFIQDRREPKCIVLNIFPQKQGLFIIFSYRKEHRDLLLPYINHILQAERYYKLYLISKVVLMYCENLVVSPRFYRTITEERINSIKKFFIDNIFMPKKDYEDENLYLFC